MSPSPGASTSSDTASLRATAHPVRLRMLSLLTGAAMSASEIARELDLTPANASYHLRVLARAGLVVEAGEERIRGGIAKRYLHPWKELMHSSSGSAEDREEYLRSLGAELVRRSALRKPGGASLSADAEMWVRPEVRDRVRDLVAEAATVVHEEALAPRAPGAVHVNLTAVFFEMADPATPEGEA